MQQRRQQAQDRVPPIGADPQQGRIDARARKFGAGAGLRRTTATMGEHQWIRVPGPHRETLDHFGKGHRLERQIGSHHMRAAMRQHHQIATLHEHGLAALYLQPIGRPLGHADHRTRHPLGAQGPGRAQRKPRRNRPLGAADGKDFAEAVDVFHGKLGR